MPISNEEIAGKVNELGAAWAAFKAANDAKLAEIEKKGAPDPLLVEQVKKIGEFMDNAKDLLEVKSRVDAIETAVARSGKGGDPTEKTSADQLEYKEAFSEYMRKGGNEAKLTEIGKKALSVGSDPDGGYLVRPEVSTNIIKTIYETSPIRQLASVQTIGSDALIIPEDRGEAAASWTGETTTVSDSNTPQFGEKRIQVFTLIARPKATQQILDDANIDIEAWLAGKVSDVFSRKENTAFVSNALAIAPRGFLTYASGTSWGQIEQVGSGVSAAPTADKLIQLYYTLKDPYAGNASWLMNRTVMQLCRQMKDGQGQYIWQPGLGVAKPDSLLNAPVYAAADMPVAGAGSLSIALADWRQAYQIVDRIGIRTLRDPFTDVPNVRFMTTKRVGGDVINFEAIKLMSFA